MSSSVKVKNAEKIHNDIRYMLETGVPYIDALVEYARINDMEVETLGAIVKRSAVFFEKIKEEATDRRLIEEEEENAAVCD